MGPNAGPSGVVLREMEPRCDVGKPSTLLMFAKAGRCLTRAVFSTLPGFPLHLLTIHRLAPLYARRMYLSGIVRI